MSNVRSGTADRTAAESVSRRPRQKLYGLGTGTAWVDDSTLLDAISSSRQVSELRGCSPPTWTRAFG